MLKYLATIVGYDIVMQFLNGSAEAYQAIIDKLNTLWPSLGSKRTNQLISEISGAYGSLTGKARDNLIEYRQWLTKEKELNDKEVDKVEQAAARAQEATSAIASRSLGTKIKDTVNNLKNTVAEKLGFSDREETSQTKAAQAAAEYQKAQNDYNTFLSSGDRKYNYTENKA